MAQAEFQCTAVRFKTGKDADGEIVPVAEVVLLTGDLDTARGFTRYIGASVVVGIGMAPTPMDEELQKVLR